MVLVARFRLQSLAQYQGQEATVAATVHELQPEFLKVVYIWDYNLGDTLGAIKGGGYQEFTLWLRSTKRGLLANHRILNARPSRASQSRRIP